MQPNIDSLKDLVLETTDLASASEVTRLPCLLSNVNASL